MKNKQTLIQQILGVMLDELLHPLDITFLKHQRLCNRIYNNFLPILGTGFLLVIQNFPAYNFTFHSKT